MSLDTLDQHMAETHGLMLLESELNEIRHAVQCDTQAELQAARAEVDSGRKRIAELEDLVRSACAIAARGGQETHWGRFVASAEKLGLNGVTARTYRVLPSDR